MVFYRKDKDGNDKKDKDGKKQLDRMQVAKAALNLTKLVADSKRTAPDPRGQTPYASMKQDKKPEKESTLELQDQAPRGGTTQDYNSETKELGKPTPTPNNASNISREEDRRYRNPYA